ncbi:MAG: hypothetical protein ABEJ42_05280 [Halobacteriaceae archaeon]
MSPRESGTTAVDSEEQLETALAELFRRADANGVDVCGGWVVDGDGDGDWDVVVTRVVTGAH